jgi:flagellar biosynthesis/type III secretory pathway protein FliH
MERMNDTAIKKASIVVKEMNADEQMREIARIREDSQVLEGMIRFEGYKDGKIHGRMEGIQQGIQQGMQKGLRQGLQQGRVEGILEGIFEGEQKAKLEMAKSLFGIGMSPEQIAEISKLPLETIRAIKI